MKNSDYTFFWSGPFSQWAKAPFIVDGTKFNCAEQYMMYKKALHFEDHEVAEQILATSDPKVQKALGRKVKNFDAETWNMVAKVVVYKGNHAKFTQNPKLIKALMATEGTTLCEASPVDKIWGIGLDEATAKRTSPEKWPGSNWLGKVLTLVREDLLSALDE